MDSFRQAEYDFEMQGAIVVGPSFLPGAKTHDGTTGCTPEQKIMLDELHKRKIDMCDKVYVLNVGGYIGESTKSEIAYAQKIGKPVEYLESRPALTDEQREVLEWLDKGGFRYLTIDKCKTANVEAFENMPHNDNGTWYDDTGAGDLIDGEKLSCLRPLLPDWTKALEIKGALK
jgi:hypothetical protein